MKTATRPQPPVTEAEFARLADRPREAEKKRREPLMTEIDYAEYVNKSIHSVRRDRRLGVGPPHIIVGGGAIRYKPELVEEYLRQLMSSGPKAQRVGRARRRSKALSK